MLKFILPFLLTLIMSLHPGLLYSHSPKSYMDCDSPCSPISPSCLVEPTPCDPYKPDIDLFAGASASRQRPDGGADTLFGVVTGLNMGFPIFQKAHIAIQLGGSFSYYNWNGSYAQNTPSSFVSYQKEWCVTAGLFKKRCDDSLWSAGVVCDMLWADNFGITAIPSVNLFQYRAEANIPIWCATELSLWATYGQKNSKLYNSAYNNGTVDFPQMFQPLSQACLGLRHYFKRGGQVRLYGGVPYGKAPYNATAAAIGIDAGTYTPPHKYQSTRYIIGFNTIVPLTRDFGIYGNGVYTKGKHYITPGDTMYNAFSVTDNFAVCCGFSYYFGGFPHSRCCEDKQNWAPLMAVADKTSMIIDVNAFSSTQ